MASQPTSIPADPKAMGPNISTGTFDPLLPLWCLLLSLFVVLSGTGCGKDALQRGEAPPSWTCDTRADEAMKREDYPESILLHERFLERSPENAFALYHLGYAYGRTGDHSMEAFYYEKAVGLGFKTEQIYFNMGMAYGELGQTAKAISSFHNAVEANPGSADNYFGLAMAYQGIEKAYEFAEEAFLKAIKIDPGFIDARLYLSVLYAETGQIQRAQDQIRKILDIDPNHREARELLQKMETE